MARNPLPVAGAPPVFPADLQALNEYAALGIEHLPHRKAALCPGNDSVAFKASLFGKLNSLVPLAFYRDHYRAALVALAFLFRDPSAVLRRITLVVVDSIKDVLPWTRAHIRHECSETIAAFDIPSFAHGYSPASVIVPLLNIGVAATLSHVVPGMIQGVRFLEWHAASSYGGQSVQR